MNKNSNNNPKVKYIPNGNNNTNGMNDNMPNKILKTHMTLFLVYPTIANIVPNIVTKHIVAKGKTNNAPRPKNA